MWEEERRLRREREGRSKGSRIIATDSLSGLATRFWSDCYDVRQVHIAATDRWQRTELRDIRRTVGCIGKIER